MNNELISFSVPDLFFTWANLFLIFLIVKKFLFKPIKGIIDKREKEVKDMYSRADEASENAQRLEQEYTEKLTKARLEATEIVRIATEASQVKADAIVEQAKIKAMEVLERAQVQIKREQDEALRKAFSEVSDVVIIAASRLLEKELTATDHEDVINKIVDEVKAEVK